MVSGISSTAEDSIQLMMQQMLQKMKNADTDGTKGLSKTELSSIDTSKDQGGANFLKSLQEQFDTLDADGNGELSSSEISAAKPPMGSMGPPPGMSIESSEEEDDTSSATDSTASTDSTSSTDSIKLKIEKMLEALLDSLSGDISDSASDTASKVSSLTKSADTDSNGSLSKTELSSVDASGKAGEAGFVKDLMKNFSKYDTDNDGALSKEEISAAMKNAPASSEAVASGLNSSLESASNSLSNLATSLIQKMLDSYKNGGLSSLTSSLGIAS